MALDDINLSFRLGYPDDLAYKLYDRKAKCLVAFKQMADAGEAYKLALKYVDKVSWDRILQFKQSNNPQLSSNYCFSSDNDIGVLLEDLFYHWSKELVYIFCRD